MANYLNYKIERKQDGNAWITVATIPSKLIPLYHEGSTPQDTLTFQQGAVNTGASTSFNSNSFQVYASRASNTSQASIVSSEAVNLTGVSKIIIDWDNNGTSNNNNKSGLSVTTGKTNDPWSTYAATLSKQNTFGRREEEIDVSTLTGNHYIQFFARDNDTGKTARTAQLNVYAVVLKED